jgi:1-acyl-sn-glycerol-3-phosphate acyltransferase
MSAEFSRRSRLVLGVTPQGTRGGSGEFKQGFARIASAAGVPVLPAILHYKKRTVQLAALVEEFNDVPKLIETMKTMSLKGSARHQRA